MTEDGTPASVDIVVVGAGIVGLAVACELARRRPASRVAVLERENQIASHQTAHNSGVIHAGVYYAPGSVKARLCVEGARDLYALCDARGIRYERCGKVIVARHSAELPRLDELERRGRANGVAGLRRLNAADLREVEPHCRGVAALHSPATGIVDFRDVARALASELEQGGSRVATGCAVAEAAERGSRVVLRHGHGETTARFAVFCAGAWSDRLAVRAGASPDPRVLPFRGAYQRLRTERAELVRALIYPVPDPSLPFLGVHLSRHIDGRVTLGPTALLAPARDAYRLWRVRGTDLLEILAWPGTWRMARRWWRTAATEVGQAASRRMLARAAAEYVPEIRSRDLEPGFCGIRAQAVARNGKLVDDFVVSRTERTLHVRNAPSPAATACLALGRMIADEVEASID